MIWGAHAPSRAGDGALGIANFVPKDFGEAPKSAREARALPRAGDRDRNEAARRFIY